MAVALALAAAAAVYALREQRLANSQILARLDEVRESLATEARRSQALADQLAALTERVTRLEEDNRQLRRQLATLLRRKPPQTAAITFTAPLDASVVEVFAEHAAAPEPLSFVEPLPITWATDWSAYQPAGLVAPAPAVVVRRKLADPKFLKSMYVGYGVLQAADVATTIASLKRGAREANPVLRHVAHNPAAFIGAKAAASVATVWAVEKLRKRSPVTATVTLIAFNATLAIVVANNVTVANGY